MAIPGFVGFFDDLDILERDLKDPERLEQYSQMQRQLKSSRVQYLEVLTELELFSLIQPSLMRELTPRGQELSNEYFSQSRDHLNGLNITANLDHLLFMVQDFSLSVYLPPGEPCHYCEMDIFVYEMADQLWRTYFNSPDEKSLVRSIAEREHFPLNYLPYLGGIDVMTQCVEKRWLEVNPREIKYSDRCTLKFVLPSYSKLKSDPRLRIEN